MNYSKVFATFALTLIALSSILPAAKADNTCESSPPTTCNQDECCKTYCLGPENYGVNAALNPRSCNGDWVISVQGLFWNAHQEGLDYAIVNDQLEGAWRSNLRYINAEIQTPDFNWNFGFKLGVGYNTTCDGWDFGVLWTWYDGRANSHVEAEEGDNNSMIAILSNFGDPDNFPTATDAKAHWRLHLNLVDAELGREFWVSKRLALRPFIGLRYASILQDYTVEYQGGAFTERPNVASNPQNDSIEMDNDFRGFGIRGGLNSVWNLGCGWGIYGNFALSIVYGRFSVEIDEQTRETITPFPKQTITELETSFRANRYIADLALGIQWSSMLCDCKYGVTLSLGWENHIFLNQNQLYRANRVTDVNPSILIPTLTQLRGDLDTQGWTLSIEFDF